MNEKLLKKLIIAKQSGRSAHSFLVDAVAGPVFDQFLQDWLKILVCSEKKNCNQCKNCKDILNHCYPYFYTLMPQSKSRIIRVEEIRDFQKHFYLKTENHKRKIGVIFSADRMKPEAANAFLKTLEEPPKDTIFILQTDKVNDLLPTIKSRCQIIRIQKDESHDDSFKELLPIFESLKPASGAAQGMKSASIFINFLAKMKKDVTKNETEQKTVLKKRKIESDSDGRKKIDAQLKALEEADYKESRNKILMNLEQWFGQLTLVSEGIGKELLPYPKNFKNDFVNKISQTESMRCLQQVYQLNTNLDSNINETMALENFCIQICKK